MRKFKNAWNYEPQNNGEDFTGIKSQTQPNMALTPSQVLERYVSGRPYSHIPGYYEFTGGADLVDPMPDISRYSKIDQIEFYRSVENELKELKQSIKEKSTKSLENTLQDKIDELQDKIDNPDTPEEEEEGKE